MENSSNYSVGLQQQHPPPSPHSEMSGWSEYIDDLAAAQDMFNAVAADGGSCSNSMISDAASSCVGLARSHSAHVGGDDPSNTCKKLKRTRGRFLLDDDPLEDTASSPLCSSSSPKMVERDHMEISSKEPRQEDMSQVAGFANYLEELMKLESEMPRSAAAASAAKRSYDDQYCSELRKRGLCLVPVSMFIHYHK